MSPEEMQFVFSVPEQHRDIWLVKDFDPDVFISPE
jgi:hypothetical protein